MRVLIVDDSAVMRKVVERAVRQAGFDLIEVLEAADGRQALDALRNHSKDAIDLVLTDINMPVMDGIEFLEKKNEEGLAAETPVVMITTEASEQIVRKAIAAGAKGYICKPFTAEQLKARVTPLLGASTTTNAA